MSFNGHEMFQLYQVSVETIFNEKGTCIIHCTCVYITYVGHELLNSR